VLDPVVNRVEMGNPDINAVLQRLQADPTYRKAFAQTFHQGAESVSASNVGTVLATFITSLPYIPNAYDRFASGKSDALSPQARLGLRLFTGKAECARCHDPAQSRFTDEQFHHSSVGLGSAEAHLGELAEDVMRRNLPIAALGSAIGSQAQVAALGRFLTSQRAIDVGAFRTPSLRNVALTAPYMHDGSIQTLEAAVDLEIYYRGLATGRPIALTAEERSALIAFLRSLSTEVQLGPEGQAAKKTPVANPERFR
jgi:cytochrome c peroxidase